MAKAEQPVTFHPAVQTWFESQFGEASPPQRQGWPKISAGQHTLILAPTGSGKTLAAFLWCIDELFRLQLPDELNSKRHRDPGLHTLYISPLKALNNDIHRNLQEPLRGIRRTARQLGLETPEIRALVRTGDTPAHVRQSMLKQPPHILITTPESLYLLLTSERGREIFHDLRYVIVDEIHAVSSGKRGVHLSLSLERLMPLCRREPVRVGLSATQRPLQRIAAFLGGQTSREPDEPPQPRPVSIVDCGQRKALDLQVISPVSDFTDLPEATVWPAVIKRLYDLINSHQTTLVFVNMRAQTERIARMLNELHVKTTGAEHAEIALAHHGSISREMRYEIEARLKAADIPAVIATASLELGIDIGSIDLVVQLAAPGSVSGGLQRIGRSGHVLSATSKGRVMPMFQSDLDDAVALTAFMNSGAIEETVIPENCLDVLAQQIVAEVAMRDWQRSDLFRLLSQSYCYRNLTVEAFNNVLEMLAGRFAEAPLRALQPRLSWDRVNDRLIGLRGSRLLAIMNGGTIPDRGYFAVFLADSNTRLGEMEEEFVFESRVGNVFFLGNNEWRIDDIRQDRIIVSPVRAIKPRPPFWKGDLPFRDFETSQKIGAFRDAFLQEDEKHPGRKLPKSLKLADTELPILADDATIKNLRSYLQRQKEASGVVPNDRLVVGEWFRDSADEPHLLLHTCFGARVNGLWAIGLAAAVEKKYGAQVQFSYDDDGLLMRALDTAEPLPAESLLALDVREMENILLAALVDTPIFSIRFRYNAARALILSRSQPNKRIPLWLQRLRASDLLQVVRQYPDFPILLETYRDCLQDVFDWPALCQVLQRLKSGEVRVHFVHTAMPSPMASGLMFDFLAENMYEMDRSRLPAQAAAVSSELLAQILSKENIPAIVTAAMAAEVEASWQHLTPERQARDAETLFAIIEQLAPITLAELEIRSNGDLPGWLKQLGAQGRIEETVAGFIPRAVKETPVEHVRRFLRVCGPRSFAEIRNELNLADEDLLAILSELHSQQEIVRGNLLRDRVEELWCDRHNFAELYRRAIAERRRAVQPANRQQWLSLQLRWHKLALPGQSLRELLARYAGFRFPLHFFEREILRSRFCLDGAQALNEKLQELEQLLAGGEFIQRGHREGESSRTFVDFIPRATGHLFQPGEPQEPTKDLSETEQTLLDFLKQNGASYLRDLADGAGLSLRQVQNGLGDLAKSGLVTSESYPAFLRVLQSESAPETHPQKADWLPAPAPAWTRARARGRSRAALRATVKEQVQHGDSRWLLTSAFGVIGKKMTAREQTERQARLLLQRYGILVKEWYRRENGLLPWYELFQVLKRLEWQGEIRRGYFLAGVSGVQFALPEAVELLESIQTGEYKAAPGAVLLSTLDPALPLAGTEQWDIKDASGQLLNVVRAASNHLVFFQGAPAIYSENYGSRLWRLGKLEKQALDGCAAVFKTWLQVPAALRPRKKLETLQIDGNAAASSDAATIFLQHGFEQDGDKLVLWPSRV